MITEITDKNFDDEVLNANIPVLVDFWAPWCAPCRIISPIVEELDSEFAGKVKFVKMNVDENPQKTMRFQIQSIPNLKLFKNGKIVDEIIGAASKEALKSILMKNL